jgi:hypothetical protein
LETGDVLVVTKRDRLGRNAMDVRATGKVLGRPKALSNKQASRALERLAQGLTVAAVARELNASRQTIMCLGHSEKPATVPGHSIPKLSLDSLVSPLVTARETGDGRLFHQFHPHRLKACPLLPRT